MTTFNSPDDSLPGRPVPETPPNSTSINSTSTINDSLSDSPAEKSVSSGKNRTTGKIAAVRISQTGGKLVSDDMNAVAVHDLASIALPGHRPIDSSRDTSSEQPTQDTVDILPSPGALVTMPATDHYPPQVFARIIKLGQNWQFPSDHIPIAATIADLRVASFNILSPAYTHYFNRDREGLADSEITITDKLISFSNPLTIREKTCLSLVHDLTEHCDIIFLQECSATFVDKLLLTKPDSFDLVVTGHSGHKQIATFINRDILHLDHPTSFIQKTQLHYSCRDDYTASQCKLTTASGLKFQIYHSHVPGSPNRPGLLEFGSFIAATRDSDYITAAVGDMNFPFATVSSIFEDLNLPSFQRINSGYTHIGTYEEQPVLKDIDHIVLFDSEQEPGAIFRKSGLPVKEIPATQLGPAIARADALMNSHVARKLI